MDAWRSERLEDRAHDRASELGGHTIERVLILAKEGAGIQLSLPALRFVLLSKHEVAIFPQHLVFAYIAQADPGAHGDGVARGQLLGSETNRLDGNARNLAGQQRVDVRAVRHNL